MEGMGTRNSWAIALAMMLLAMLGGGASAQQQTCLATISQYCQDLESSTGTIKCCTAFTNLYRTQTSCLCDSLQQAQLQNKEVYSLLMKCGAIDASNTDPCGNNGGGGGAAASPPPPTVQSSPTSTNAQPSTPTITNTQPSTPTSTNTQPSIPTSTATNRPQDFPTTLGRSNGAQGNHFHFMGLASLMGMVLLFWRL